MWPRVWPGVSMTCMVRPPKLHDSPSASATSMPGMRSSSALGPTIVSLYLHSEHKECTDAQPLPLQSRYGSVWSILAAVPPGFRSCACACMCPRGGQLVRQRLKHEGSLASLSLCEYALCSAHLPVKASLSLCNWCLTCPSAPGCPLCGPCREKSLCHSQPPPAPVSWSQCNQFLDTISISYGLTKA